jgi:hypothetical protein
LQALDVPRATALEALAADYADSGARGAPRFLEHGARPQAPDKSKQPSLAARQQRHLPV